MRVLYGAPPTPEPRDITDAGCSACGTDHPFDECPCAEHPPAPPRDDASPGQPLGNADAVGRASADVAQATYHVMRAFGTALHGASEARRERLASASQIVSRALANFMAALAERD